MKKLILILLLLVPSLAHAQVQAGYGVSETSLSTVSAGAVTGTPFSLPTTYAAMISWTVVADGSAISVNLEGSLDNSTYFVVDSITTPATGALRNYGFTGIKFVRISQVSRTGGTVTTGTFITNRGFINAAAVTLNNPVFAGQVALPIGSLGTPGVTLGSIDTTTGWYRSSANAWSFQASGALSGTISQFNWTFPSTIYIGSAQDASIVRAAAGELTYAAVAFAALGTPANGTTAYCSDCAPTTPASCPATKASCICAGAGVGSWAFRANALWYCPF